VTKWLRRHWGWAALALAALGWYGLVAGWFSGHVPAALVVIALVSVTGGLHLLFREPLLWCGAATREGERCRNNAKGLLMGCNQVRQHKWQKVQLMVHPSSWSDLSRSVFYGTRKACAALAAVVTFVSGLAGIAGFLLAVQQLH
jgi:hypothetical protein